MFTEGQMVLGRYLVQSEIARDEFGPVYRAVDVEQGSVWRLSRIDLAPENVEALRAELEQIRALQSDHIASADRLETTEQAEVLLASEWIEGSTLEDVIREEAPLKLSRACSLARQISQALEAAHHAGIVHGDLKPGNIFVTRGDGEDEIDNRETILVGGFGSNLARKDRFITLARLAVNDDGGALSGAPEYVSPEQAVGTSLEALDGRTDLYPLGVILYEMLTGEFPYPKAGPMETLLAHIFAEPRPLPSEIPAVVATLVRRTLSAKRADRPAKRDRADRSACRLGRAGVVAFDRDGLKSGARASSRAGCSNRRTGDRLAASPRP